jgi:hypothetical protein
MATPYDNIVALIKPRDTVIAGLKYFPDLEPEVSNDRDGPLDLDWLHQEVSDCNLAVVRQAVGTLGKGLTAAMEIGVNRNGERSMSRVIMDQRPEGSFYLGIDIEDKSYLDDADNNTWTIRCSSDNRSAVLGKLQERGVEKLDLIMIDGWHSVNMCVNDWHYTELLSDHGMVILHDTNKHPGCVALFDAVDEDLWIKERFCTNNDYGIATFKRRA